MMFELRAVVALSLIAVARPLSAQTDYYNTDAGRPLRIEDAYPTERYAFEFQIAPLRLERSQGGVYQWSVEPELAYGILPRTHVEVGLPISYVDAGSGSRKAGIAGVELSLLHNLNVETSIPALAIVGDVLLPVGRFGPDKAYVSAKGIATRTLGWARFHLNGLYTFGSSGTNATDGASTPAGSGAVEISRWLAGLAVDKTYPLRSMLVGAEVFARRPLRGDDEVEWNTAVGVRYQLTPRFNVDGGVGKQLSGDDRRWFATFGLARAFAVRSLFPVR